MYGSVAALEHVLKVIIHILYTLFTKVIGFIFVINNIGTIITTINAAIAQIYAVKIYFAPTPNTIGPYSMIVLLIKENTANGVTYI